MAKDSIESVMERLSLLLALKVRGGMDNEEMILLMIVDMGKAAEAALAYEDPNFLGVCRNVVLGPRILDAARIARRQLRDRDGIHGRTMRRLENLAQVHIVQVQSGELWHGFRPLVELLKMNPIDMDEVRRSLDEIIVTLERMPDCQPKEKGP